MKTKLCNDFVKLIKDYTLSLTVYNRLTSQYKPVKSLLKTLFT